MSILGWGRLSHLQRVAITFTVSGFSRRSVLRHGEILNSHRLRFRKFIATVAVVACAVTTASACSIPVFRYALEHWHPGPYLVSVFHRGELTPEQLEQLAALQPKRPDGMPITNVKVRSINLDGNPDEESRTLWESHQSETLPWLVVQKAGPVRGPAIDVWSGELTAANAALLVDSPVRKFISERLLEGESVVWLFLDSGDKEKDDAAYALLTSELERLKVTLELPPIDPADAAELSVAPEGLKLSFQAKRVSRDDPAEAALVQMLLSVEPDVRQEPYIHMPMAFPVFGRGCALYTLAGDGINPRTIEDACRFLIGGCQCTVKEQNPGSDLLLAVDWDLYVEPSVSLPTAMPPLGGLRGLADDGEPLEVAAGDPDAAARLTPISLPQEAAASTDVVLAPAATTAMVPSTTTAAQTDGDGGYGRMLAMVLAVVAAGVVLAAARGARGS